MVSNSVLEVSSPSLDMVGEGSAQVNKALESEDFRSALNAIRIGFRNGYPGAAGQPYELPQSNVTHAQ
jgi:hypothetical protein